MKTIDLIYFNAGGGHRAAATALGAVIREQRRPWAVRLVNIMEVIDPQDLFRKTLGMEWEDLYNARLARGWSPGLGAGTEVPASPHPPLPFRRHPPPKAPLAPHPARHGRVADSELQPHAVPGRPRRMPPRPPYVTLMTDFADLPPHFWIEPGQAQHFICGTAKAVAQAYAMGYGPDRVHATSGMIVRPDFYRDTPIDRRARLAELGLDPDRPTGIVLFGGHGSKAMQGIARRLTDTQLILICGHNAALAERLAARPAGAPRHVVGFTPHIRDYMQVSDFFIGKPGPGSISEAIQQRLPAIVVRNTWTLPQERYNAEWVD